MKIGIIGAGISGLTVARELNKRAIVKVFEKADKPGGLIKCDRIQGSLFHTCGGHVFNTKIKEVNEYFWSIFNKDEFLKAKRNSSISLKNTFIPYPIENYIYLLDDEILRNIISEIIYLSQTSKNISIDNFKDFLLSRFGKTLYNLYFKPYNEKIWLTDLSKVPIAWLDGKLPMPSPDEIIFNNIRKIEEKSFVHSSFWYEKFGGSQLLADTLAEGLDIKYNSNITTIGKEGNSWYIEGEIFDLIVFCGNIKDLPTMIPSLLSEDKGWINDLKYHGTTSVFCELDNNPYSWVYLPDSDVKAHRIICTGNFSPTNNGAGKLTGTIEFTDYIDTAAIKKELPKICFNPKYITHKYNKFTYPIQDKETRSKIILLKKRLENHNIYSTGRFVDWEYYNMDLAIYAAIKTIKKIKL